MDPTHSPTPPLPALIETYLARCAVEGKSPRAIAAYRESLARFQRCLQEDGAPLDPDRIRPDHVIAYLCCPHYQAVSRPSAPRQRPVRNREVLEMAKPLP